MAVLLLKLSSNLFSVIVSTLWSYKRSSTCSPTWEFLSISLVRKVQFLHSSFLSDSTCSQSKPNNRKWLILGLPIARDKRCTWIMTRSILEKMTCLQPPKKCHFSTLSIPIPINTLQLQLEIPKIVFLMWDQSLRMNILVKIWSPQNIWDLIWLVIQDSRNLISRSNTKKNNSLIILKLLPVEYTSLKGLKDW